MEKPGQGKPQPAEQREKKYGQPQENKSKTQTRKDNGKTM
jgi:hypothetical protein